MTSFHRKRKRDEMGAINEKAALILRAMIGAYLVYLSYGLFQDMADTSHLAVVIAGAVIFGGAGIALIGLSGWKLWKLYKEEKEQAD